MEKHLKTHPEKEEGWGPAYMKRIERIVVQDKYFASVIPWSMGNVHCFGMYSRVELNLLIKVGYSEFHFNHMRGRLLGGSMVLKY